MTSFGEKLRQEREARNVTLREIATETKIGLRYLKALESGDFATLPGGVFNKGYVRAYASYIGADADGLVQAYVEEERNRGTEGGLGDKEVLRALAETAVPGSSRRPVVRPVVFLVPLAVALAALATWAYVRFVPPVEEPAVVAKAAQPEAEPETDVAAVEKVDQTAPPPPPPVAEPAPVEKAAPVERSIPSEEPPPIEQPEPSSKPMQSGPPHLSIPEYGVGTGVVNRQLQGRGDRFTEGTQIWFWTRVTGGEPGDRVRHVWLREGRLMSSVELKLGGPHWRTQSRRTLPPDSAGSWAVEARDAEGRVLAREEFVCVR